MKLFGILSPTWVLASYLKSKYDRTKYDRTKYNRTKVIVTLNCLYLSFAIVSVVALVIYQQYIDLPRLELYASLPYIWLFIWAYFLFSRCNEIFYAFLNDAFDKLSNSNKSRLKPKDRIKLALKSYLELIINFAILYLLLPSNEKWWVCGNVPSTIFDGLYFSGVTITTLGYGDISPAFWFSRLLVIYEVFCGFILLIVCFTIYTNKANESRPKALNR